LHLSIKLRIVVAFITFLVGVGFFFALKSHSRVADYLVKILSPQLEGEQFIPLMDACGPEVNTHQYLILSTGQSLDQTGEVFQSAEAASRTLERRLERASRIMQHTKVSDGEKVIAVFPSGASIFRRHGVVLATINAPTVEIALEFEATIEKLDH
jgi:hypothetical protein